MILDLVEERQHSLVFFHWKHQRDAMVADLTRPEQRTEAYSVLRISSNLGWATGPAIGGFLAGVSYLLSFGLAAGACFIFFVLTLFLVRETMPAESVAGNPPFTQEEGA